MKRRAALVLAGGEAKRFQTPNQTWQDKALAQLDGKPLLVHVIENLQGTVDEIAVCINSQERQSLYRQVLDKHRIGNVKFVFDQKSSPIKGPLLAIASGLQAINAEYCLVVPTDMPFLNPKVADYLLNACNGYDVAVPMWPDGTLETLLMALQGKNGLEMTQTLTALNRANADNIARAAGKLQLISPLKEISQLDPKLQSFININSQQDLTELHTRSIEGPIKENICFERGKISLQHLKRLRDAQRMLDEDKSLEALSVFGACACQFEAEGFFFWAAVSEEKLAETQIKRCNNAIAKQTYRRAAENYTKEALLYQDRDCTTLAQRALTDKEFCNNKATA